MPDTSISQCSVQSRSASALERAQSAAAVQIAANEQNQVHATNRAPVDGDDSTAHDSDDDLSGAFRVLEKDWWGDWFENAHSIPNLKRQHADALDKIVVSILIPRSSQCIVQFESHGFAVYFVPSDPNFVLDSEADGDCNLYVWTVVTYGSLDKKASTYHWTDTSSEEFQVVMVEAAKINLGCWPQLENDIDVREDSERNGSRVHFWENFFAKPKLAVSPVRTKSFSSRNQEDTVAVELSLADYSFRRCRSAPSLLGLKEMSDADKTVRSVRRLKIEDVEIGTYERGKQLDEMVVRVCVKKPTNLSVIFEEKRFTLNFETDDPSLLSEWSATAGPFELTVDLYGEILPFQSSYKIQGQIEIILKKKVAGQKWPRLTADERPPRKRKSLKPLSADSPDNWTPSKAETKAHVHVDTASTSGVSTMEKPTCKVSPYDEKGIAVTPGFTGLKNIGNTCFINATLQVLINLKEIREYFLDKRHKGELNKQNPLGFGGKLAESFSRFVEEMWSGMNRLHEPSEIKELVAKKATQFANFAQHDAQEFLSFLLDGLHEDLNRIVMKPYTQTVESGGRPDREVAAEAWDVYKKRNDSIIVDLFHGLLKSRLQCPKCSKVSITFDPFAYLPVPFPKNRRKIELYFWPVDCNADVSLVSLSVAQDGTIGELLHALSTLVHVPIHCLRLYDIYKLKFHQEFDHPSDLLASSIRDNDLLFAFQVHDPAVANERVLNIGVVQRTLYPKRLGSNCHFHSCQKTNQKLMACTKCFSVVYCSRSCQEADWEFHRHICDYPDTDRLGFPFLLSIPESKVTYQRIVQMAEARCRSTVNIFQCPQEPMSPDQSSSPSSSSFSQSTTSSSEEAVASSSQSSIYSSDDLTNDTQSESEKKVRLVLGQPRDKWRFNHNLFSLRKCKNIIHAKVDRLTGAVMKDTGLEPLNLHNVPLLALDWHNRKNNKENLVIESKRALEPIQLLSSSLANGDKSSHSLVLQELLQLFTERETLGQEEAWYCSTCKAHQQATKSLVLWQLAPIVIIQLKRFVYTPFYLGRSKTDKSVIYPIKDLDLKPYLCAGAPEQETKYDLCGVVCHSGSSYFGHYVSFGRLADFDTKETEIVWRHFDDSLVTKVAPSQARSDNAYLLFYKRHGSDTKDLLDQILTVSNIESSSTREYSATDSGSREDTSSDDSIKGLDHMPKIELQEA